MKFIYPAIIRPSDDGGFRAVFPDIPGLEAQGDTLEEAVDNANDVLRDCLEAELLEDNPDFPPVTPPEELRTLAGDTVRNIAVNVRFYVGWDE